MHRAWLYTISIVINISSFFNALPLPVAYTHNQAHNGASCTFFHMSYLFIYLFI